MLNTLTTDDCKAIPLTAINANSLKPWLETQPKRIQAWVSNNSFSGKPGSFCLIPNAKHGLERVLVGTNETIDLWDCADLTRKLPARDYYLDESWPDRQLEALSLGWALGAYRFDRYRPDPQPLPRLRLDKTCSDARLSALLNGIGLTRDLINTPAQDMMPEHLAASMEMLADEHDAEFTAITGEELLDQNFPVIHAVGRASAHPPQLLDLRWGKPSDPCLTLVGKGVCFDSGGLNLKPANGMRLMKKDMGGAAHVLGLASMIMQCGLPVRLRVLIPAVENAVSGNAFRPGDVLTSRSGKSIEIDNTDAEGRLVLADALSLALEDDPQLIIDMATLTGAARVALGTEVPALFSNRADTAQDLKYLGEQVQDPLWPMPLHKPYRRWLNSDIADLQNCSTTPFGGAITAALFLQEFVGVERDWVHIDVMAWNTEAQPGRPRGGEAMGLRAFLSYLEKRFGP